jgi:hypothetical protein
VDQWAAGAAAARRIPFHFILPVSAEAFTTSWDATERDDLGVLLAGAASVQTTGPGDTPPALAYDLRNEAVVRRADLLVAVWTGIRAGGTFHTICAARSRGLPIEEILLASRDPDPRQGGRGL